jgi:hypothetical protein
MDDSGENRNPGFTKGIVILDSGFHRSDAQTTFSPAHGKEADP